MQEIDNSLAEWARKWGMEFNVKKCKFLYVGKTNPRYRYFLNGEEMKPVKEEKDIGVWIEENLKPSKQCATAAKAANFAL